MSNLAKIAASLRAGLEADAKDRAAWIERVLERARLLAEARATILSNEVFGQWLDQEKIDINANDRAALLSMARYPELARTALERSESVSAQRIWNYEIRPLVIEQDAAKIAAKMKVVNPSLVRREEVEVAIPVSHVGSHRSEPAKKSILSKSLLPPGTDEEAFAQQGRWDRIFRHLEALC